MPGVDRPHSIVERFLGTGADPERWLGYMPTEDLPELAIAIVDEGRRLIDESFLTRYRLLTVRELVFAEIGRRFVREIREQRGLGSGEVPA